MLFLHRDSGTAQPPPAAPAIGSAVSEKLKCLTVSILWQMNDLEIQFIIYNNMIDNIDITIDTSFESVLVYNWDLADIQLANNVMSVI